MKRYGDQKGNSGIRGYESGEDFIVIWFKDCSKYKYSYKSAGANHIEEMKSLAAKGKGLNTYPNTHVSDRFER